jgi:hypothetical protein
VTDHVDRNRVVWDRLSVQYAERGRRACSTPAASRCWTCSNSGPRPNGTTRYPYVTAAWARRWLSEEIWRLRKR